MGHRVESPGDGPLARVVATSVAAALAVLVLTAKLALIADRPLCPRGLSHDDLLFVDLGHSILTTGWLGPYNRLTLIKMPFLPIFLAATRTAGVPYLLGQELLYLASVALVVIALAPVVRSNLWRCGIFACCVLNPATLSSDPMIQGVGGGVVTREPLYAALTLIVFACLIGLWTHREARRGRRLAWALGLGCALGPFWLTREEGPWIVPSLVVGLGAVAWWAGRRATPGRERRHAVSLAALPLALLAAALAAVAALNWWHYGAFILNELHARPFQAAYGAMTRVEPPEWTPNLPVPAAVRRQLYEASPAFRDLSRFLEDHGAGWYAYGCGYYPHTCGDLAGGWFLWALRDSVAAAGYHASATAAAAYYLRVADEINAACDERRLSCAPSRVSLIDPIRWAHIERLPATTWTAVVRTVGFADVHIVSDRCTPIEGMWLDRYEAVTGHVMNPPASPPAPWQVRWSSDILAVYQRAVPPLMLVAMAGYAALLAACYWTRRSRLLFPSTLIFLALVTRFILLAVADVVSTVPYAPRYYQPAFALVLLFVAINLYSLVAWNDEPVAAPISRRGS